MKKRFIGGTIILIVVLALVWGNYLVNSNNDKYAYIKQDGDWYISRYAKIDEENWQYYENEHYKSPQHFLYDVDQYVDKITHELDIADSWYLPYEKNYSDRDFKINFLITDSGSHVQGGYYSYRHLIPNVYINAGFQEYNMGPVVHEVTHILTPAYSSLSLREGLACYMQDKYGNNVILFNYGIPPHQIVQQELDEQDIIDVIGTEGIPTSVDLSGEDRSLYYIFSHSFSQYLIEEYGLEKFMMIYRSVSLDEDYETIYEKDLAELKQDWIDYIEGVEPLGMPYTQKLQEIMYDIQEG